MISESAMLSELAAEFPGYEFSTQPTWEDVSLIAVRRDGPARPLRHPHPRPGEMRCALLENMGLESERPGDENHGS